MPECMWNREKIRGTFKGSFVKDYEFVPSQNEDAEKEELVLESSDIRASKIQGFRCEIEADDGWRHFLWNSCEKLGFSHNCEDLDKQYRVDIAGNVISWHAAPKSVLAWEVDHFYPHCKGGFSVVENLHLAQASVNKTLKNDRLWHEVQSFVQIGISKHAFLFAFERDFFGIPIRAFSSPFVLEGCYKLHLLAKKALEECGLADNSTPELQKIQNTLLFLRSQSTAKKLYAVVKDATDDSTSASVEKEFVSKSKGGGAKQRAREVWKQLQNHFAEDLKGNQPNSDGDTDDDIDDVDTVAHINQDQ